MIELLDESESTTNPRLASPDTFRDDQLGEALITVERSDDPSLLEIGQPRAASVPLENSDLGSHFLQLLHLGEHMASAEPLQDSHSLEPVDQDQSRRLDLIGCQDGIFDLPISMAVRRRLSCRDGGQLERDIAVDAHPDDPRGPSTTAPS